jgi:lipopolysaccharide heptosyltransferase II
MSVIEPKILIIKPSSMGDIIHANPALVLLKKLYPKSSVSWLVFKPWKDLLRLFPDVDNLIYWDKKGGFLEYVSVIRRIKKEKFDVVIDLQGLMRSAIIARLSGAKIKIGVPGMKELSWLILRNPAPYKKNENAVYRCMRSVWHLTTKIKEFCKSENETAKFNLKIHENSITQSNALIAKDGIVSTDKVIGIVPFSRGKSKQWPIGNYKKLVDLIVFFDKSVKIIVLGSDKNCVEFDKWDVINLCGKTSLTELAGILKRCKVVIGGDTGPIQLASAIGVPVVAIFGGSDVNETAPVSENAAVITKNFQCSPCRTKPTCSDYPCLSAITSEEVFEKVKKWIKSYFFI